MKQAVKSIISETMDNVMNGVLQEQNENPLYTALVPDEIFRGSRLAHRFVTDFDKVWRKLVTLTANEGTGYVEIEKRIHGVVYRERLIRIAEVLNRLEHRGRDKKQKTEPDWDAELAYILEGKGEKIPVTVIIDVYAENSKTGERLAFELKAPLPNSDQTKVSKEKIFKLYCMEPAQIDHAYYALPHNPYGRRQDYSWSFPARWFNMREDDVVLIGDEFWERVGGMGTYHAFIEAVNEIGKEYKERIYREYLGIEPPIDAIDDKIL